jgi:amino acid adenylation domain-containing protein
MKHDNGATPSATDAGTALKDPSSTAPALISAISRQVQLHGDACALRCGEYSMTYLGLQRESDSLARLLLERGAGAGEAVALLLPRCVEFVVAMLAVQKIGAYYVPVDPALPDERIDYLLQDCGARLVVSTSAQQQCVERCTRIATEQVVLVDRAPHLAEGEALPPAAVNVSDRIYAIYTSGSTGRPKGAINFHGAVANLYDWFQTELQLNTQTRSLILGSLSFDLYHKGIFAPLLAGGCVVLSDQPLFDAHALRGLIERERITLLCATPSAFGALVEDAGEAALRQLDSLQVVSLGGEAVLKPRLRSWLLRPGCRTRLLNTYGPTECADIQSFHWVAPQELDGEASIPIGRAIPGCELYVLDEELRPVAPGASGALWLGGVCVGGGYLNLPDKTAEAFRPDPFRPGHKMYRTGDIAAWRGEPQQGGVLEYHGRADRQVKIRGYRLELDEIEAHLSALPQVQECAALAPTGEDGERRLHAYVRLARDATPDAAALRRLLAKTLPDYALPGGWTFLDAFPYNNSGKIDRNALPAAPGAAASEGGTLEQRLSQMWQALIGCEAVEPDAPFMELGGTSLLAVRFLGRLAQLIDVQVPVADFFAAPTVRRFSAYLRAQHAPALRQWIGEDVQAVRAQGRHRTRSVRPAVPIAVIGMACRVPGADDLDTYWDNIRHGRDMLRPVAADGPAQPGEVRVAGWIEQADCFDHAFFRYTPGEAAVTDPQQRILLECAWHALEHAGIDPARSDMSIGVYASVAANSYLTRNLAGYAEFRDYGMDYASIGNDKDFAATRIAYKLDLHGPALSVQTGCSASGTALHTACLALEASDCDAALVGGAALPWRFSKGHTHVEDGPFSRDGRIRAFDAEASGMVMTGGTVCVVLKRLDDALADGDTIHSVIRATALNNDGSAKAAFTAPNAESQSAVVRRALARAGVDASRIGYVEAHGTGTPLGDPIEVSALTRAYRVDTGRKGYCAIGSVKGNIGHLDAAAACASLVKASLVLGHARLPPQPHFNKANPECRMEDSPFYVNTRERDWPGAGSRHAAISSFGFGGTNFHAVLEQAPQQSTGHGIATRRWQVLRLSAKTPQALQRQAERLAQWRGRHPQASLADAAYTLDIGRARFAERGVIVAADSVDAAKLIRGRSLPAPAGTVWMFPGQGTQYAGMGEGLYRDDPAFRQALDRCAELLMEPLGADLRTLMFSRDESATAKLRDTAVAQPAIFSFSYALAQTWLARGLRPQALVGHSIGEFVAATLAGVFTLEDVLPLIALRGRLMGQQPRGSMLAARSDEAALQPLPLGIDLAAVNAPRLSVLSGPTERIEALQKILVERGIAGSVLHTSHAFHSSMMQPAVAPFTVALERLARQTPNIPIMSTVTGQRLSDAEARSAGYWAQQLRLPVRFADAVRALAQTPGQVFLEVGPGQSLSSAARQTLAQMQAEVVASQATAQDAAASDEAEQLEMALGRLWIAGIELEPEAARQRIGLPGYPFERVRHWIEPAANAGAEFQAAQLTSDAAVEAAADSAEAPAKLAALLARSSGISLAAGDWERGFVELGFDSLLLTQVAVQVRQAYGIELRLRMLMKEVSTPRALARHLQTQAAAAAKQTASAAPTARNGDAPPCEGARLGLDAEGNPAWYVPSPLGNGTYVQVGE